MSETFFRIGRFLLPAALLLAACEPTAPGMRTVAAAEWCRLAAVEPIEPLPAVLRPTLGLRYRPAEAAEMSDRSPCAAQALVDDLLPGLPAGAAGLRPGDLILALDGEPVCAAPDPAGAVLGPAVRSRSVGETVTLRLLRQGEGIDLAVPLADWPSAALPEARHRPSPCPKTSSLLQSALAERELLPALGRTVAGLQAASNRLELLGPAGIGPDPFRLPEVTWFLRHPFEAPAAAGELTAPLAAAAAAPWALAPGLDHLALLAGLEAGPAIAPPPATLPNLVALVEAAAGELNRIIDSLPEEARAAVRHRALPLREAAGLDPKLAGTLVAATPAIRLALRPLAIFLAAPQAEALRRDLEARFPGGAGLPWRVETAAGAVVVGTPGPDTYDEDAAVILDPGGDDLYRNNAGATRPGMPVALVIDWSGDDRYVSETDTSQGAAFGGGGFLLDLGGRNLFSALDRSQGSAVFGVGVLLSLGDGSRFQSRRFAQGAAFSGLALLWSGAGSDEFDAGEEGQGYGQAGGVGALVEAGGSDHYRLGGLTPDFRDPEHATVSFGQGCGDGVRAEGGRSGFSGGIGLLVDVAGDDRYDGDYFAQGCGYYFGLGLLHDLGGSDRYRAGRYAQGAGIHQAIGLLIDDAGDDSYEVSVGVAQGLGHDEGIGLLYDRSGSDAYRGGSLVQGAATSGSLGLLVDAAGRDSYTCREQGQGFAAEPDGLGLLVDGEAGEDRLNSHPGAPAAVRIGHGD